MGECCVVSGDMKWDINNNNKGQRDICYDIWLSEIGYNMWWDDSRFKGIIGDIITLDSVSSS